MSIIALKQRPSILGTRHKPIQSEIVPIGAHSRVLPPGSDAIHHDFGWVFVQFARGNRRQVIWYEEDDSCAEEPRVIARVNWVWLHDLSLPGERSCPPLFQQYKSIGILKIPDLRRFPFAMIDDKNADRFGIRCA